MKIKDKIPPPQKDHRDDKADGLGADGSPGGACGSHLQRTHQQNIQRHVHSGGNGDKQQGMLGIPHAPEYRADSVVSHHEDGAAHADVEISQGLVKGL